VLCGLALAIAPAEAVAQRSHSERVRQQRRLAERRERSGDRFESQLAHERHCDEVGWDVCEEEERHAAAGFARTFVYPALPWIAFGVTGVFAVLWISRRRRAPRARPRPAAIAPSGSLDVVAVDLVLDAAAAAMVRANVEGALARHGSAEAALRDVARLLILARGAWTHVAVRSWPLAEREMALGRYHTLLAEARARGTATDRDVGGYRAVPDGPAVLVSVTVLSRDELREHGGAPGDAAGETLTALAALAPARVQGADISWLPAERGTWALPLGELLARHPRLIALAR